MAIQDAGSISEEVFKAKAPYLIPTEGIWARGLGRIGYIDLEHKAALSGEVKKRSYDDAAIQAIRAANDPVGAIPTKRLSSRHENRASKNG